MDVLTTPSMDVEKIRFELMQMTRDDLVTFLEHHIGNCLEPSAIKRSFLDDDDVDIFKSLFVSEITSSSSSLLDSNNDDLSSSRSHLTTTTNNNNEVDDVFIPPDDDDSDQYEDQSVDMKEEDTKVKQILDYRYYRQKYHLKKLKIILTDIAKQKVVMCDTGDKINRAQTKVQRSKASAAAFRHQQRQNYFDEKIDNVVLNHRGVRILPFEKKKTSSEDHKKKRSMTTSKKKDAPKMKKKLNCPVTPGGGGGKNPMEEKSEQSKKIAQDIKSKVTKILKRIEESEKNNKSMPKMPLSYILPALPKIHKKKEEDTLNSDFVSLPPPQQQSFNNDNNIPVSSSSLYVRNEKVAMSTQPIICIDIDDDDDLVEVHHVQEEPALKAVELENDDDDDDSSSDWSDSSVPSGPILVNGYSLATVVSATILHQRDGKVPLPPQHEGEEVDSTFGLIYKIAQWFLTNDREPFFQSTPFLSELEEDDLHTLAEIPSLTPDEYDEEFDDDFEIEDDHFGHALVEFRAHIRTGGTGKEEVLGENKVGELILDQKYFKTVFKTERGRSYHHEQFKTKCHICNGEPVLQSAAELAKHLNNFEHRENFIMTSLNIIGIIPPKMIPISEDLQKEVDKESLNTVKRDLESRGRWTWALEARWKSKEDEREALKMTHVMKRSKFVQNAEDHPLYAENWTNFWERRHTEICQKEGSFYADNHDYTLEWEVEWGKIMTSILHDEFFHKLYEIHVKYGMDLTTLKTTWQLPPPDPADVFKDPVNDNFTMTSWPDVYVPPASLKCKRKPKRPANNLPPTDLAHPPPVLVNNFPDPPVISDPRAVPQAPRPPAARSPAPRGFPLGQQQQHNRQHTPSPGQFRRYDPDRGRGRGRGQFRGYRPRDAQYHRHNHSGQYRRHSSGHHNSNHRHSSASNFQSRRNDFKKHFSRTK